MKLISDFKKFAKKKAKEMKAMGDADLTPHEAKVGVAGQEVRFKVNVERQAAWKLYVELNTRIATQPMEASEGILREALSSFHDLFGITREILKEAGPGVAQGDESLGFYAMEILNQVIRPVLTNWHPALSHWEEKREPNTSRVTHEKNWERAKALRKQLELTRKTLLQYSEALAILARVSTKTRRT